MTIEFQKTKQQSAVIPTRITLEGALEVLLITNKDRTRWVVPKGNIEPELTPMASAAKEAWEEAGLVGEPLPAMVGEYAYEKNGIKHLVEVFVMADVKLSNKWPEMERRRRWCSIGDAMELVYSKGLAALLPFVPTHLNAPACAGPVSGASVAGAYDCGRVAGMTW